MEKKKKLIFNRDVIRQLRNNEVELAQGGIITADPTCPAGPDSAPPGPIPPG